MQASVASLLATLANFEVDLVVVGGVAAILEGAPVATLDLDVLFRKGPENEARLLAALGELDALYRDPMGREIRPDAEKLRTFRLHRLITKFGPLDLLTEIDPGLGIDDVLSDTELYEVEGQRIRSLRLETLIRSKEHADRDKDRAVLPILRRALELRRRSSRG